MTERRNTAHCPESRSGPAYEISGHSLGKDQGVVVDGVSGAGVDGSADGAGVGSGAGVGAAGAGSEAAGAGAAASGVVDVVSGAGDNAVKAITARAIAAAIATTTFVSIVRFLRAPEKHEPVSYHASPVRTTEGEYLPKHSKRSTAEATHATMRAE